MKLSIKANEIINKAKIIKDKNGYIAEIQIDFEQSFNWSDLEMWLFDNQNKYLDYIALNVSKRNKLQTHK